MTAWPGLQGLRDDDRGDGVGRVVEAVEEVEGERRGDDGDHKGVDHAELSPA